MTSAYMPATCALLTAVLATSSSIRASVVPRTPYEVTTETGMPHLEENLRYTITRERRCLAEPELLTAFPVLSHPALKGCRLAEESRNLHTIVHRLVCEGKSGTTGQATWRRTAHEMRGSIEVKLGGKNMTFHQRVTARPLAKPATAALGFKSKDRSSACPEAPYSGHAR